MLIIGLVGIVKRDYWNKRRSPPTGSNESMAPGRAAKQHV